MIANGEQDVIDWAPVAEQLKPELRAFIGGKHVDPHTDASFIVENAFTTETIATLATAAKKMSNLRSRQRATALNRACGRECLR